MSSEFKELVDLCDRILVLCKGKIVGELASEDADSQKLLSLSLGG
jgi:ribose transport system ATP-binding protein